MTSKASKIDTLPNELLEKIFGHITCFKYKAQIRLVCKKWYDATGGAVTPYAFFKDSVMEFGKDLQDSQELQSKVKSLRVDKHRKYSHGSSNKSMTQVFPFCANLEELILAINPTNDTYAEKLGNEYKNCSITSPVPRLKRLGVKCAYYDTKNYMDLVKQLSDSLTHLNWETDCTYHTIAGSGMNDLVESIGNLKSFNIVCKSYSSRTYLPKDAIFPFVPFPHARLEEFKIRGQIQYHFSKKYVGLMSNAPISQFLKSLDLNVQVMDIWCLKYITEKFKMVETLSVQVSNVLTVGSSKKISKEAVETIIQDFCKYCKEIKGAVKVNLFIEGREERFQISHN